MFPCEYVTLVTAAINRKKCNIIDPWRVSGGVFFRRLKFNRWVRVLFINRSQTAEDGTGTTEATKVSRLGIVLYYTVFLLFFTIL